PPGRPQALRSTAPAGCAAPGRHRRRPTGGARGADGSVMTALHSFRSMGCEVVVGLDDGAPARALETVRTLFAERDARFTRFAGDSELLRVNGAAQHILVSAEFARALRAALAAARETDGVV